MRKSHSSDTILGMTFFRKGVLLMQVKCEYCGSYINDLDEKCPNCGATNENHKRTADGTPKTIEQLKDWYKARNLPPEEVTRFFVGKDIREPKAFGVYEENGTFYVYKNKADGTRAIRYQGADEAYAVNELYMRLKEEILNQKRNNLEKNQYAEGNVRKKKSIVKKILKDMWLPIFGIIIFLIMSITHNLSEEPLAHHKYYISASNNLFYYSDSDWWNYDFANKDWHQYEGKLTKKISNILAEGIPPELKKKYTEYYDGWEVAKHLNIQDINSIDIHKSRRYLTFHPVKPLENYYRKDGKTYYFLDDIYGSRYGSRNNTGWYCYNDDNNSWEYYSSYDDEEKLGELYYAPDDYISYNERDIYDFSNIYIFLLILK